MINSCKIENICEDRKTHPVLGIIFFLFSHLNFLTKNIV